MKDIATFSVAAVVGCLFAGAMAARDGGDDEIAALVKKLASADFRQRHAATESLKKRPAAGRALRESARTADLETTRRITEILAYHENEPVRRLHAAAKDGRVEEFIQILGSWEHGRAEDGAWREFRAFTKKLFDLHQPKVEAADEGTFLPERPFPYTGARVTEATTVKGLDGNGRQLILDGRYFLRVGEMDVDHTRPGRENVAHLSRAIVATQSARFEPFEPQAVFVGGALEILCSHEKGRARGLYVSGGDVVLHSPAFGCLIIARGKVTCKDFVYGGRIISGKTVSLEKRREERGEERSNRDDATIISENDSNPLGFVRWEVAPKEKETQKGQKKGEPKGQ